MAVTIGHRPGPERTRVLLERIAGGDRGAQLRSQVAGWNPGAAVEQVEEAFQEACVRAERACTGQSEGEVYVWLRTTTHHELGHMRQRARREVLVDISDAAFEPVEGSASAPIEDLIKREDHAELERLTGAVLEQLSERQRAIVALHSHGLRRRQIAEHLHLTPRVVKRSLEQIMTAGRTELVRLAGHGCAAGEPLVARLAFGLAGPREIRDAQLHLATCPRCGTLYERLDLWRERVAVLLPIPAAEQARPGSAEWALHRVGEAVASLKQHAAAGYARAVDPTPIAGMRPGAAAAAIAGCLAIGGGTTYCVSESVDPIGGLGQLVAPARDHTNTEARKERVTRQQATPTPTPSPAPTAVATPVGAYATPSPQPTAEPTPRPTPEPTPPPTPQEEYEPLAPAATTASQSPAARPEPTPAPAPAGGPGEFDGP